MSVDDIKKKVRACVVQMPNGHAVQRVRLFGSHLHGKATEASDVDLLIDLDENVPIGFFAFYDLVEALSRALNKKADVVTPEGLSRYIKDEVLGEAEVIYERQ